MSEATQEKAKARDDLTLVTVGDMFEVRRCRFEARVMSGRTMAEWKGLGAQILSRDLKHEHVRQQLFRLDAEFVGEVPGFSVPYCRARPDSQGFALWDMHGERSAASKAVCGTKTEESHRERP